MSRSSAFILSVACIVSCTATPPAQSKNKSKPVNAAPKLPAPMEQPVTPSQILRTDFWLDRDPVQGGLVRVRVPSDAVSVTLDGAPVVFEKDGFGLIGFDRDAAKTAVLIAKTGTGKTIERRVTILPTAWKIENVNTRKSGGAATTAEFEARRGPELARIAAARRVQSASIGWRQDFIWPLKGRVSGLFGAQRVYQGVPGSPHGGMDIAAVTGTPFVAPADGIVTLAAKEPFTLEGHLLMIDHGMGLNSAFLHCSELLVEEGQFVKQGQIIGKVGMTGRASGPHLHWGMKWNAARVDPKLLVPAQ
jgi:murein DD-endopeptidase MepM/ murein hydrolase activator NlpD